MQNSVFQRLLPIGLLILSNLFMTIAWYGHLNLVAFGFIVGAVIFAFLPQK